MFLLTSRHQIAYEQFDSYVQEQQNDGHEVAKPTTAYGRHDKQPVVNVTWLEAVSYSHWLGKQTNNQCRLPTEAEWEYATCAETEKPYPWGENIGVNNASCDGCESQFDYDIAAPVESFNKNKFDLYDMSGNVWEWTCSSWRKQFDGSEQQCNNNTKDTHPRVLRGGSFTIIQTSCAVRCAIFVFRVIPICQSFPTLTLLSHISSWFNTHQLITNVLFGVLQLYEPN